MQKARPLRHRQGGGPVVVKTPAPAWECDYAFDRRAHRHRCRCCSKIINVGERVIMTRVRGGTFAIHALCGTLQHSAGGWTWRDVMDAWGTDSLIRRGFPIKPHPMSYAGSVKS